MIVSRSEENKNKLISGVISLALFALLFLFLFLYIIITPNPPFPLAAGGGGGTEINFGTYNEGTGQIENNGIGDATSVIENTELTAQISNPESNESILTSENGEIIDAPDVNPKIENHTTVITPTKPSETLKPKEKTMAEKIAENALKNKGNNGGGDGNSGHAGNEGSPDGNPKTHGTGGVGGGDGGGNGPGHGPGSGPGAGGYGFSLAGRSVVKPPQLPKDTKEEGKVVVEITVDKNGTVIKAEANGRGTNTNSSMLKTLARQAAFATKFTVSGQEGEQKGTITIVFSF
jgi:TonB family protein